MKRSVISHAKFVPWKFLDNDTSSDAALDLGKCSCGFNFLWHNTYMRVMLHGNYGGIFPNFSDEKLFLLIFN